MNLSQEIIQLCESVVADGTFNPSSTFLFRWHGRWLIDTNHGFERIKERSKIGLEGLKKLFQRAMDWVDRNARKAGEYLFFSKSLNQGFVAKIAGKNVKLITFLPFGKHNPKPGTKVEIVENYTEVDLDETC